MYKIINVIITIIATSFYLFPIKFTFFQLANTKMMLAVCGLCILGYNLVIRKNAKFNKGLLILTLFACGVSLASLLSMVLNGTPDGAYFSYVISMWVWTSAGYAVVMLIKHTHKKVSVEYLCYYLIAVCAIQCVLAIMIDTSDIVRTFVYKFYTETRYLEGKRIFGIGCAVDVAGGRFAAILIMISFLLFHVNKQENSNQKIALLLISYGIIAIVGNIIGRTTTIGLIISIIVIVMSFILNKSRTNSKLAYWVIGSCLAAIVISVYLYETDIRWQYYLEFAFEGFFSLVEKGRWEVHSNDMLMEGFIFPDNLRGWLIGDGYFGNTDIIDPYYNGETWYGYYKGTDAGYSRFLFYFGLIGLAAFYAFLIKVCQTCMRNFPSYKYMFLMILMLNFIIWIKVSTDIYCVFAPFVGLGLVSSECSEKTEPHRVINTLL